MAHQSRKLWSLVMTILAVVGLLGGTFVPLTRQTSVQAATPKQGSTPDYIQGPFSITTSAPTVFRGDLRDLPQISPNSNGGDLPEPKSNLPPILNGNPGWVDPAAQQSFGAGKMPVPLMNFDGLSISDGGGWHPPDTNGDVGPNHYIETVNIAIGIYDKATGNELVNMTLNNFFQGPPGSYCDTQNRGDPIVQYDPQVDRWIVSDFSLPGVAQGYYECIAVSITNNPVSGGWYFYQVQTNVNPFVDAFADYPKFGVWSDGWYMSGNMFNNGFEGVSVWAFNREDALLGQPIDIIYFACTDLNTCGSLLPANVRGNLPPAGSPEYFANVIAPNQLALWKLHADFATPGNSTFTGPTLLTVDDFALFLNEVPQKNTTQTLDSLGDRMMYLLQYRNINGTEALFANHSVWSGGVSGIRWYEIRDPGGTPFIFQQGTYQPDSNYRWMGSIAADKEGNVALGYSVSSSQLFPSIRYTGRLAGEIPGQLTQGEASLIGGAGSQVGSNRWGDYSSMSVDPVDDCTFWYTQEYLKSTSGNWDTRIGSFKFPSCGQPKGFIEGFVRNSVTNDPVVGAPVVAQSTTYTYTGVTNVVGHYQLPLIAGDYDVTAGPLLPGYPTAVTASLTVTPPNTTTHDFLLEPVPDLVHSLTNVSDPTGNNNGFPEPGEPGLQLTEGLLNIGAIDSTNITARLSTTTPGVTIAVPNTTYPDIPVGSPKENSTPYVFSLGTSVPCGSALDFQATITDSVNTYSTSFSLDVGVPQPRQDFYINHMENGAAGWTTGGSPNTWALTTSSSHSPTHSWTDSPSGNYSDNTNNWVRTQALNLTGVKYVHVSGWFKYALEPGYDYAYVEYSLNGGLTWATTPLATFNGTQSTFQQVTVDASVLDNQPNVALRVRLTSDGAVTMDGIYVDDFSISYVPFECTFTARNNIYLPTILK